jgi:hypothetical protein
LKALRLAPWVSVALALACDEELETRASAARVARAIELLRNAPNAGKGQGLSALEATACRGEDVCRVKRACVSAYTLHVEGVTLTEAARLQIAQDKPHDAARVLGAAEQKLAQAGPKLLDCSERVGALRRQYKL